MDVVWGETAGVKGQLLFLCPVLFILQGFEAYLGLKLLKTALAGFSSDWQVITCGILLIIMAVGNFANTVQTLAVPPPERDEQHPQQLVTHPARALQQRRRLATELDWSREQTKLLQRILFINSPAAYETPETINLKIKYRTLFLSMTFGGDSDSAPFRLLA
ncbi:transmembrane 120 homolog [Olea europaea subsp. europaea]|uniref:Transmembrane 120 homolog n=1 Tax=Olea europaea subsp. europaea TaxID=158383 RepID=A0A8S0QZJ0_OLEEU|nr:transmembrane 120 homolog [Olea europaea subsp. europaea]